MLSARLCKMVELGEMITGLGVVERSDIFFCFCPEECRNQCYRMKTEILRRPYAQVSLCDANGMKWVWVSLCVNLDGLPACVSACLGSNRMGLLLLNS